MSEEEILETQEPNTEKDKTLNEEEATDDVSIEETDDVETLKKQLKSALAQKEHFRKKATQPKETPKEEKKPVNFSDKERVDIIEFATFHKDLNREDIEQVSTLAKGLKVSLEDAYKHPILSAYFEKINKEKQSKEATVHSTRSPKLNSKGFEIKSGMSREEHKKLFEQSRNK